MGLPATKHMPEVHRLRVNTNPLPYPGLLLASPAAIAENIPEVAALITPPRRL